MMKRREFLEFMGRTTTAAATWASLPSSWIAHEVLAAPKPAKSRATGLSSRLTPLAPSSRDELTLSAELRWEKLIEWNEPLNRRGDRFGYNNDFIAFIPRSENDAVLWINHEYPDPAFLSGGSWEHPEKKTREQIALERRSVGGSLIRSPRETTHAPGGFVLEAPLKRRRAADTPIPFAWPEKIAGTREAIGTFGNCAGGRTPWGTVLSCEENFQDMYPWKGKPSHLGWERFFPQPVEHYGWVVEVNPLTGAAKKLVALGRFCHEGATFARTKSGLAVVYMGDDGNDQCLYKFISHSKDSLERGSLYVANLTGKKWVKLDRETRPELKMKYATQTELLIEAREAAHFVSGTPLDRPEDIELDPRTGAVIIALTNNKPAGRPFGSLLRLDEAGGDAGALEFESALFIAGGPESGIACPDNLAFDPQGRGLWVTSDMAGSSMGKEPYLEFENNSLFFIPLEGPESGRLIRVGNAPVHAELTGPCFSPDGQTLFLSVQHPGEESPDPKNPLSHWPNGGNSMPRPAVVMVTRAEGVSRFR